MLTSERIAELRARVEENRLRALGYATPNQIDGPSGREMLMLLDAYEAQRPRPASEVPATGQRVLARFGSYHEEAFHDGSLWYRIDDEGDSRRTFAPDHWLPLPEVPE